MNTRNKPLGDKNLIGEKVVDLRNKKGLTQVQLLAKIHLEGVDMGISTLSELEGQHRGASDKDVALFAKIFGVSADYLLGN